LQAQPDWPTDEPTLVILCDCADPKESDARTENYQPQFLLDGKAQL
jgi:hypothetical protein